MLADNLYKSETWLDWNQDGWQKEPPRVERAWIAVT